MTDFLLLSNLEIRYYIHFLKLYYIYTFLQINLSQEFEEVSFHKLPPYNNNQYNQIHSFEPNRSSTSAFKPLLKANLNQ